MMKAIPNINQQLADLHLAMASLRAINATVQSVMICGKQPVIRIARNGHCEKLIEKGQANYIHVGCGSTGLFRQGVFEQYGCRIIWSESLLH
ncbi:MULTISPECIES: hypothetical protein [Brenneria]|uniref:Uncharacterized protein n=1 Tax=Brenneria populi TaxID=1505588 RepID=A0ABU6JV46_9GAMM|nr:MULTISPECIES: hypothetical protein [Brenneria]MDX5630366.1 hypothetical protein [Brenneria sp. L3-3Z]MDX5697511.1 hypothetical protein [Brenneria sp. L4-2C]MEC5344648.1 hypothetical protein [Brenneria populi Li et al. 2015]